MNTILVKDLQMTKLILENKLKNYFGDGEQKSDDNGFKNISEQLLRINELLQIGKDIEVDYNGDIKPESEKVKKRIYKKRQNVKNV